VSQKSRLAEAIRYALSRWAGLCLFLVNKAQAALSAPVRRSAHISVRVLRLHDEAGWEFA